MSILIKDQATAIAEAVKTASPQEVSQLEAILSIHPHGEVIKDEVNAILVNEFLAMVMQNEFGTPLASELVATGVFRFDAEAQVDQGSLHNASAALSTEIAQQLAAKELEKQIREQLELATQTKILTTQIKAQVEVSSLLNTINEQIAAQNLDVAAVIKAQLDQQSLSSAIQQQMQEQLNRFIGHAVSESLISSLEEVIEGILDGIVDSVIAEGHVDGVLDLSTESIDLYQYYFATKFFEEILKKGLFGQVDYTPCHTAYIISELSAHLTEQLGYELAFEIEEGKVFPVLQQQQ